MRASRRTRLATGIALSMSFAAALWFAAPLVADARPGPAKKQASARPLVRGIEVPALRPERRGRRTPGASTQEDFTRRGMANGRTDDQDAQSPGRRLPREERMRRGRSFDGDVRSLPQSRDVVSEERPEREAPPANPVMAGAGAAAGAPETDPVPAAPSIAPLAAAAPAPESSFEGLDRVGWGAGFPPDTNGDVGPEYYIQTINTSVGIYRKVDGVRVAAFTFNTLMSQGQFGNLCDTNNFGDPVVLYDTFEDRWIITDFAFSLSAGAVVNPPGAFQCFAASKTGDPVAGGWNFYSINTTGGLGDYPKLGIWPDAVYMSVNMFGYPANAPFQGARAYALNKAQMYAGAPAVQVVSFDAPAGDFTLLPSNARLQTGTPPSGMPNLFVSTWQFLNAVAVYKFHVDWNSISLSSFTGPDLALSPTSWPNAAVANPPSQGGNSLDALQIRAMMQNQYSNIAGAESLWATHTVRRENITGFAAPRWYQVNVTGGAVAPNLPQAATWDPDAANLMHRFMPSLAVDRAGNMALGYSTSSSTTKPAIKYAGRLAGDPVNTFSQTEQLLTQGAGTQVGNCGGSACQRWGDYSAMTLDPNGCTFWFTTEYYQADGLNYRTRIGSFTFPACTPVTNGTLQGIVKTAGGLPIAGAIVALGVRTATTDASGFYSLTNLPAGTYPSATASFPGYLSQTVLSIAVNESAPTTRDFTLGVAPAASCITDTTQADFQAGVAANCDLIGSAGDVILVNQLLLDQQQLTSSGSGSGFNTTSLVGQTFVPGLSGQLAKLDISMFCSGCSGANPAVIVEIRPTSGGLPTSAVLASTTIPGFSSGSSAFYTATFAAPVTVVAGTTYAFSVRAAAARTGIYAAIFSATAAAYANGNRVGSGDGGATWVLTGSGNPLTARDLAFRTFVNTGFVPAGTFVSSTKDANPAQGATPTWGAISWTAAGDPATAVRFQAAASNNPNGPFTFVGPDGTGTSFFANGASLSQFDGNRYLKYRALLNTSSSGVTPALNDVTICFANVKSVTALVVDPASGPYAGETTLTAALSTGGAGLVGKPIAFTINGAAAGTALTNGVGVATLSNVSLVGIPAGTYPGGVTASFAGELGYTASTASSDLAVAQLPLTVTADDKVKVVGAPNPPLTGTLTGVVPGDGITASYSTTATTASPAGFYPIVPSLADPNGKLGNYSVQSVNGTLSVMFAPAGQCDDGPGHQVLQPLNPDGSDVFQRNRTIPVKFRVCDVNGVSIGAPNVVSSFLLRQIIRGTVTTDVSIAPESTNHDTGFRLDGGDRRWMFNLSTKNLESGATYGYRIALVDGSAIEFRFTLR